jgi:hypothetical protein
LKFAQNLNKKTIKTSSVKKIPEKKLFFLSHLAAHSPPAPYAADTICRFSCGLARVRPMACQRQRCAVLTVGWGSNGPPRD